MERIISLFMALLTIFSLSVSSFAMDVAERDQEDKCQELTFEEVVLRKMAYDNISCAEAKEELLQEEARILEDFGLRYAGTQAVGTKSELIKYYNYEKTFVYPDNTNFSCAINATIVTVSDYGTTRYIDRVDMLSTRRVAGMYSYEWIQQSVSANISADKKSVRLAAAGHFSVTVTTSSGAGFEIGGFTYSGTVGTMKLYLSNTMYPTTTYYA